MIRICLLLLLPISIVAAQPNILWLNIEDLDDTLGCYGDTFADTPNLDQLAQEGILYRNAFANAPICAPARNCLITGMYPTSIGGQHLRSEVTLPEEIQPFPVILKEAGYYVTNYAKTDYNFSPDGVFHYWKKDMAPWRKRAGQHEGKPFFSFFVFGTTHEGPGNFRNRYEYATRNLGKERLHDPAEVTLPPYYPDTPKFRELWARYYDLVSAVDLEIGEVIKNLKEDGLYEDTVIWFFSDHGHGMPRHKRWLLDSGLRVPFIVRIPEKYQHLAAGLKSGSETEQLVSFVDFVPTVLSQAGLPIPEYMQGRPFLGETIGKKRKFIYGARDRADDLFEISRAVHDGRLIYVRHFLPHIPYMPGGRILGGSHKESIVELRRLQDEGGMDPEKSYHFWSPRKPCEELYDLDKDPHEIHNLVGDPNYSGKLEAMRKELKAWILENKDTGFLHEAEYQLRALHGNTNVYDMAQSKAYDIQRIYAAAERATLDASACELREMLNDPESGVRYWGAVGMLAQEVEDAKSLQALESVLEDDSPSVAIAAAEALCLAGKPYSGLPILEQQIGSKHPWVALQASRAMHDIGELAKPAIGRIEEVRKSLEGKPGSRRRYRDFNYASFAGWALEWALINCGAATPEQFE